VKFPRATRHPLPPGWVRREGGGRKTLVESDPGLLAALLALVRPTERGEPESPLRWTCLSLRQLEAALKARGHPVSHMVVGTLLKAEGFSLQANRKTLEGSSHPDRDAQFGHIARSTAAALAAGEPVICKRCGVAVLPGWVLGVVGLLEAGSFELTLCLTLALIGFRGGDGFVTQPGLR